MATDNICPVCGFPDLAKPAYSGSGLGSLDICPSCGFQFGFRDDVKGVSHEQWRERWVAGGMRWRSHLPVPPGWDPEAQLAALMSR